MANKNFVVHNGLTVGLLTIDASTGDINTPGNVNISGSVGVSSIAKNDSSIVINDTGSSSTVYITIDGSTEHTVDSDGVNLASGDRYAIAGTSVLNATTLGGGVVNSSLTTVGNLTTLSVAGGATVYGNLTVHGLSTLNGGTLTLGDANTDNVVFGADINSNVIPNTNNTFDLGDSSYVWKNVYATNLTGTLQTTAQPYVTVVGNLQSLSASGTVRTTGIVYANSSTASSSTSTGALVVIGGVGVSGTVYAGGFNGPLTGTLQTASQTNVTEVGNLTSLASSGTIETTGVIHANTAIYITGKVAATVDDATALSIALGG